MAKKVYKYCIFFVFFWISLASCVQGREATSVPEPSAVGKDAVIDSFLATKPATLPIPTPTNNPNFLLKTQEPTTNSLEPSPISTSLQIASGNIQDIWWSNDSDVLYYGKLVDGNFAYNLRTQEKARLSVEDVLRQTPQVGILDRLPPYYGLPYVSPSGTRAIYIKQSDAPPVITPDESTEGGEQLNPSHSLEMWLWENGVSHSLGTVKQCWFSESFWSVDEQEAVLVEFGVPMPSCTDSLASPQAWLMDLEDKTSHPLFSRSEYPPLQVYGFSPDGNYLLYGFYSDKLGANLSLLNVDTLKSIPINVPINAFLQWINDTKLLVTYRNQMETRPYPVGILDWQSLEFCNLLPMFEDKYVQNVSLSPNRQWIAFTTGQQLHTSNSLWLMNFDLDFCLSNPTSSP